LKIVRTGNPDEPISQVLLLQQDEDDENKDDARCREGLDQRRYQCRERLKRAGIWLSHFNRDGPVRDGAGIRRGRRTGFCGFWPIEFFLQISQHLGSLFERPARRSRAAQRLYLLTKIRLITRQITCQLADLSEHQGAKSEDHAEREQDDNRDCCEARQIQTLKEFHEGRQHKAEQHGERHWQQYFATKVKGRNDRGSDEDAH